MSKKPPATTPLYHVNNDVACRTFFDGDRWAAHEFIGTLLAQGCVQFTVSTQGLEITVAWPRTATFMPKDLTI